MTGISILHAELIPDCTNTSAYSSFISAYGNNLLETLSPGDKDALLALLKSLTTSEKRPRPELIKAFEAEHPALFKRLYGDLIAFYYATEEAQARSISLANAAPRDGSEHFNPALLDAVITNQSGKRRL